MGDRFVLEREGCQQPRFFLNFNVQLGWWIAGVAVMVTAYQHDAQIAVLLSPGL
ncbi:hypothetical protein D3C81_1565070 [compost metagenome]